MSWAASVEGDRKDVIQSLEQHLAPQRLSQSMLGRELMDLQLRAVRLLVDGLSSSVQAIAVNVSGHCGIETLGSGMISLRAAEP